MHGLVARALQGLITDTHGAEIWAEICSQAGGAPDPFGAVGCAEALCKGNVITAAAGVLHRPAADLWEDLGRHLVTHPDLAALRRLLRASGRGFRDFLLSLEDLPGRARLAMPGLDLPELRLALKGETRFQLSLDGGPPWAGAVLLGLLRAMAEDYGSPAEIRQGQGVDGHARIDITLPARPVETVPAAEMTGSPPALPLDHAALSTLMPLHLRFDAAGRIIGIGPTLARIAGGADLVGAGLLEGITVRHPQPAPPDLARLLDLEGQALRLMLPATGALVFDAMLVRGPDGDGVITLSLAASQIDQIPDLEITASDFPACDHSVDLLFAQAGTTLAARDARHLTARLQAARRAAEDQAMTDALTGLHNRRAMDQRLQALAQSPVPRFGLMHLDLDFFKEVNDTLGHAAGDHVLTHVADILRGEIRQGDIVARVGGDEFVLLFQDCDDPELLNAIGNRLIARLEEPTLFEGQTCRISASAGSVLASRYERPDPDRMLNDADIALYTSKNRGRAQHTYFGDELLAPLAGVVRPN